MNLSERAVAAALAHQREAAKMKEERSREANLQRLQAAKKAAEQLAARAEADLPLVHAWFAEIGADPTTARIRACKAVPSHWTEVPYGVGKNTTSTHVPSITYFEWAIDGMHFEGQVREGKDLRVLLPVHNKGGFRKVDVTALVNLGEAILERQAEES